MDVIERNQYDTIYHEHVRTYCLKSVVKLFSYYDMEVFRVERVSRYGGNIRVFTARKGLRPVEASVGDLLRREAEFGLYDSKVYADFRGRVEDAVAADPRIDALREKTTVVEDPQSGDLRRQALAVDRRVLRTDAEQDDQPMSDGSGALAVDLDRGSANALHDGAR